jgi:hypothetical protein
MKQHKGENDKRHGKGENIEASRRKDTWKAIRRNEYITEAKVTLSLCLGEWMYGLSLCLEEWMYRLSLCLEEWMYRLSLCLEEWMYRLSLCLGEWMYRATIFVTSAVVGESGHIHDPAGLPPVK